MNLCIFTNTATAKKGYSGTDQGTIFDDYISINKTERANSDIFSDSC